MQTIDPADQPAAIRSGTRSRTALAWLPLLREELARRGRFTLPLRGNSMRPTLPTECDIDIVPPDELAPGQLVVFVSGDALVAHRLVRRAGAVWIAQGDNRRGPDRGLNIEQILGKVVAAQAQGHPVWPGRFERALAWFWLARYQALRAARWAIRRLRRRPRQRP